MLIFFVSKSSVLSNDTECFTIQYYKHCEKLYFILSGISKSIFAGCGGRGDGLVSKSDSLFKSKLGFGYDQSANDRESILKIHLEFYIQTNLSKFSSIKPGNYSSDKELLDLLKQEYMNELPFEEGKQDVEMDLDSLFRKYNERYNSAKTMQLLHKSADDLYIELRKQIPNLSRNDLVFIKISEKISDLSDVFSSSLSTAISIRLKSLSILSKRHGWREREHGLYTSMEKQGFQNVFSK